MLRLQGMILAAIGTSLFLLSSVQAVKKLRIVSPLQTLTIHDPESKCKLQSPREKFLPKFQKALAAEKEARSKLAETSDGTIGAGLAAQKAGEKNWAERALKARRKLDLETELKIEAAFEQAMISPDETQMQQSYQPANPNKYQFVGVVNPASAAAPISWYSRLKPKDATWSLRLVHPNRQAILKDLFDKGKIDVFGRYENTGRSRGDNDGISVPLVKRSYAVRDRSWKNLWNFSVKNFFSDSSGMYWRERRLPPGLYTDGEMVYQASYRYRDGRNGMHRVGSLAQYKKTHPDQVKRINDILTSSEPDVVLEE